MTGVLISREFKFLSRDPVFFVRLSSSCVVFFSSFVHMFSSPFFVVSVFHPIPYTLLNPPVRYIFCK